MEFRRGNNVKIKADYLLDVIEEHSLLIEPDKLRDITFIIEDIDPYGSIILYNGNLFFDVHDYEIEPLFSVPDLYKDLLIKDQKARFVYEIEDKARKDFQKEYGDLL